MELTTPSIHSLQNIWGLLIIRNACFTLHVETSLILYSAFSRKSFQKILLPLYKLHNIFDIWVVVTTKNEDTRCQKLNKTIKT